MQVHSLQAAVLWERAGGEVQLRVQLVAGRAGRWLVSRLRRQESDWLLRLCAQVRLGRPVLIEAEAGALLCAWRRARFDSVGSTLPSLLFRIRQEALFG